MLACALNTYSPARSAGRPPKRAANSNRPVWSITPSRFRVSAISAVPLWVGITTTLSAASGPGSRTCRWNSVIPIIAAMAMTTAKVRAPLMRPTRPLRSRSGFSGGGGATVGLIASPGERGESRCGRAGSPVGSCAVVSGAGVFERRKNIGILSGPARPVTRCGPGSAARNRVRTSRR